MSSKLIIGLDVSNLTLDYCEQPAKTLPWSAVRQLPVRRIENSAEAIITLGRTYSPGNCMFILEPTGSYSDKVLEILSALDHHVYLVGTRMFNSYCQFLGIGNKNDQQAARTLAHIGSVAELPRYEVPSKVIKVRKKLFSALEGLEKDQQRFKNRIHAEEQYLQSNELIMACFRECLELVEQKIRLIEKQLNELKDEEFKRLSRLAQTVVGIGQVNAELIVTLTNGFKNFESPKQAVKFCGFAPRSHKSGSSVNIKKRASKQANTNLRRALFMAALSAIRFNSACKELYTRLRARGKGHFHAMNAVMAKLVRQLFAVIKYNREFDNQYLVKTTNEHNMTTSLAK